MEFENTQPESATPSSDPISAPVAATPATPDPAAQPIPSAAQPAQIPAGYVPSFRLREQTETYRQQSQQWQQQQAQYQAQITEMQRQRDALLGIGPKEDPNNAEVRQQFAQLFPTLAKYEEMGIKPEQVQQLLAQRADMEAQQKHYWHSYGRRTMDTLFEKAATSLGSPLTDQAKGALHSAFTGYISSSPELMQRYANDPSLLDEFWTSFSSSFIEPARRIAATNVAERASVPIPQNSTTSGFRVTPAPQINGVDDRVAAAWAQYQQIAKK